MLALIWGVSKPLCLYPRDKSSREISQHNVKHLDCFQTTHTSGDMLASFLAWICDHESPKPCPLGLNQRLRGTARLVGEPAGIEADS